MGSAQSTPPPPEPVKVSHRPTRFRFPVGARQDLVQEGDWLETICTASIRRHPHVDMDDLYVTTVLYEGECTLLHPSRVSYPLSSNGGLHIHRDDSVSFYLKKRIPEAWVNDPNLWERA